MDSSISGMNQSVDQNFNGRFVEVTDLLNKSNSKRIFVAKDKYKYFSDIMNSRNKSFNNLYIYKQLISLKGASIFNSVFSRDTISSRILQIEGGHIIYYVRHDQVYITDINIQWDYKFSRRTKDVPAGVYRVQKDIESKGEWAPSLDNDRIKQIDQVRTRHLAVNGQCEDIADAARYMSAFIQYGHGEATLKDTYTLFFNPSQGFIQGDWRSLRDSFGIGGTQAAKKLAAVLIITAQKNMDINLTVHGSGHALLKEALRIVSRDAQVKLNRFTVFYANPTHNLAFVDKWRSRTGMQLVKKPPLINTVSAHQFLFAGNAVSAPVIAFKNNSPDWIACLYTSLMAGLIICGAYSIFLSLMELLFGVLG